ncbi:MAG: hypothetical protein ACI3ZS_10585 [Candidatus Cryptobacteroides sp.]
MFSIVTTQKILERLYTENSVWGKIVAQTKCFYVKLDSDWWEEEENALLELANSQADIKNANDLFVDIEKHPEVLANYPTSVFILDIDEGKARQLQQKYGVVVQSFEHLDDAVLTAVHRPPIYTEENEPGVNWSDVFFGVRDLPINAIIINDRNLFTNDQVTKDASGNIVSKRLNGVGNVLGILEQALPQTLDVPFHVLVVCDKEGIERHLSVKKVITYLNALKKQISRPYNIVIELLAITNGSMLYKDTHNRRILTNYGIMTFDHKLNAFEEGKSLASQRITVEKFFSYGDLGSASPFVKEHNKILKDMREYLDFVKRTPRLAEHEFAKNGRAGMKFSETEHRMIIQ